LTLEDRAQEIVYSTERVKNGHTAEIKKEEWPRGSRGLEATRHRVLHAIRVKIRNEGMVNNRAVYLAIGVRCSGHKEILGLWIEQTEGAKF
jgi:transposase-like protein